MTLYTVPRGCNVPPMHAMSMCVVTSPMWACHLSLSHVRNDDEISSPRVGNNLVTTDLFPGVLIQMSTNARPPYLCMTSAWERPSCKGLIFIQSEMCHRESRPDLSRDIMLGSAPADLFTDFMLTITKASCHLGLHSPEVAIPRYMRMLLMSVMRVVSIGNVGDSVGLGRPY